MVDIIEVSAIVTAVGVLFGVVYYALEMREQTTIRKTGLMVTLYSWIQSDEYQKAVRDVYNSQFKDYEDFVKKNGSLSSDAPIWRAFVKALGPMDMIGTMLYRKQIDSRFAYDLWGTKNVQTMYEKVEPLLSGLRREFSEPGTMIGFEYLKDELVKKESQLRKTWGKYMSQNDSNSQHRGVKNG